MESPIKPPRVSSLIRAAVFAGIALFSIAQPFNVMQDVKRTPPMWFWPAVWGSMLFVVALCGTLAFRIAREGFPPKGTLVFPVIPEPRITLIDICVAPFAGLFLLTLGLLPTMFNSGSNDYAARGDHVMQMLVAVAMGGFMLLWRPTFHVTKGEPIVRYPMGAWLPWKKALPIIPKLEWRDYYAGKSPRRQVGWSLHADIAGRHEFEIDFVPLDATREEMSRIEGEWRDAFGGIEVGTPEQQRAAVANDKPVMPWHMLAAMLGIPMLLIGLGASFQKFYNNVDMVIPLLIVLIGGALTLWFASRFFTDNVISILALVLAAASFGGVIRGRNRAEASVLSGHIARELKAVCDGKPAQHAAEADAPELLWAAKTGSMWSLLNGLDNGDVDVKMPKKMMCLRYASTVLETKLVRGRRSEMDRTRMDTHIDMRDPTTGAVIASRSITGGEPPPFPESVNEYDTLVGKTPSLEEIERAFQP